MHLTYLTSLISSSIICFILTILLIVLKKKGETSSNILAIAFFISSGLTLGRYISVYSLNNMPYITSSVLLGHFLIVTLLFVYPLKYIFPNFLNKKRYLQILSFWIIFLIAYIIALSFKIPFNNYGSITQMISNANNFDAQLKLTLALFIISPIFSPFLLFFIKIRNYQKRAWTLVYLIVLSLHSGAFAIWLFEDYLWIKITFYIITTLTYVLITYLNFLKNDFICDEDYELEDNLDIDVIKAKTGYNAISLIDNKNNKSNKDTKEDLEFIINKKEDLEKQLTYYMHKKYAWRNPKIDLKTLALELKTNRTSLTKAIKELGFNGITDYVSTLRVKDVIQIIESKKTNNHRKAFYEAGFRSNSSALRHFKQITGKTPKEYFPKRTVNFARTPDYL